jgi:hypothetical protein
MSRSRAASIPPGLRVRCAMPSLPEAEPQLLLLAEPVRDAVLDPRLTRPRSYAAQVGRAEVPARGKELLARGARTVTMRWSACARPSTSATHSTGS